MNPKILILTPFRNEDKSISQYVESIKSLQYPKDCIDLYWLENDSTDQTLEMLTKAKETMLFSTTTLESVNIIGPVEKKPPGEFVKDIGYGEKRIVSWLNIWNKYFFPTIRSSDADYVLPWYADTVCDSNVISELLKVFNVKKDAGWVGGAIHKRYPFHTQLRSPLPAALAFSKEIVEAQYTGHVWMMPKLPLEGMSFFEPKVVTNPPDIHQCLIIQLKDKGLKVYYQPTVFLKHISSDGKIYTNTIGGIRVSRT